MKRSHRSIRGGETPSVKNPTRIVKGTGEWMKRDGMDDPFPGTGAVAPEGVSSLLLLATEAHEPVETVHVGVVGLDTLLRHSA